MLPASPNDPTGASAPPTIRAVEILYAENKAVPRRTFASLWDADAALARAFAAEPPPTSGYDKVSFRVEWTDRETHEGRLDVSTQALAQAPRHGGLLRQHLHDYGRWLAGDDHARMCAGRIPGDELERRRAWGVELLARLDRDARAHVDARAVRNAITRRKMLAATGSEMPELRVSARSSSWAASLPQPPRLLPSPEDQFFDLHRALQGSFAGGRVNWADPSVTSFVNYITRALRADLRLLNADDAAVIGWRWHEAVRGFQRHRAAPDAGDIYYRALTIARQVGYSQRNPGLVFESFCPWRKLYFDRTTSPATQAARRTRLEVNPWEA